MATSPQLFLCLQARRGHRMDRWRHRNESLRHARGSTERAGDHHSLLGLLGPDETLSCDSFQGAIFLSVTSVPIDGSISSPFSIAYHFILSINFLCWCFCILYSNELHFIFYKLLFYVNFFEDVYISMYTKSDVYCQMLKVACYIPKDLLQEVVPLFAEIFHYASFISSLIECYVERVISVVAAMIIECVLKWIKAFSTLLIVVIFSQNFDVCTHSRGDIGIAERLSLFILGRKRKRVPKNTM